MNQFANKQLIFDFLAGKATADQRKQIDEWYQNPQHQELFYEWLEEWEQSHLQFVADKQQALNRYHHFLDNTQLKNTVDNDKLPTPEFSSSRLNWFVWTLAASLVIVLGCWQFQNQLLNYTYSTTYGQIKTIKLEDGSQVTLNANSILRVPRFGGKTREVKLEGEALFMITHTAKNERFVVKTDNGVDVVVLGTEFSMFARKRATQVVLQKGKVEFHYQQANQNHKKITLKPGDLVSLEKDGTIQLKPTLQPTNYSSWRDHRYVFEETTLKEVSNLFQENFGIKIKIPDPKIAALSISGAYQAQTADELIAIIAEVLNLQITREGDELLLSSNPI